MACKDTGAVAAALDPKGVVYSVEWDRGWWVWEGTNECPRRDLIKHHLTMWGAMRHANRLGRPAGIVYQYWPKKGTAS